MNLAFIDIAASYHAASVFETALGGSQSAVCYLSRALVKKGARITLINQLRFEGVRDGIANAAPEKLDQPDFLKNFDAVILSGRWTEKLARNFRAKLKPGALLTGWMHEACFQIPYAVPAPEFSAFVFVSPWQQQLNAPRMPPQTKSVVIGNAVAPFFHELFEKNAFLRAAKATPPVAVYSGSSKRGLLYLPDIIPVLCHEIPGLSFEIYSDCAISTDTDENARSLEKFRAIPGVTHAGAVPQNKLAAALKRANFLISPNDYPETFCIALAEAMAAGLSIVTTRRAALPDTAAGFAELVDVKNPDTPEYAENTLDVKNFTARALPHLRAGVDEKKLREQVDYANAHYRWEKRAQQWIDFLEN